MKKVIVLATLLGVFFSGHLLASSHGGHKHKMKDSRAVPMNQAKILQEGEGKKFCPVCGMNLPMFYKTNHAATVDGNTHQYCSAHCAYEEATKKGSANPKDHKVIDNTSLHFIDAKSAYFVVGSKKPATMSMVSKYAFAKRQDAEAFAQENGGDVKNYQEVSKIVNDSLEKEVKMIAQKQKRAGAMGEKIYAKMCKQTDKTFQTAVEAKTFLEKTSLCGNLKGKKLHQVSLYLRDR